MGRGQQATDHFAQVLGRRRGRALDRALQGAATQEQSERALSSLEARLQEGDLASVVRSMADLRGGSPTLTKACGLIADSLLPDGWEDSAAAWASQFPVPLVAAGDLDGLHTRIREDAAADVEDFFGGLGDRMEGDDWDKEVALLESSVVGTMRYAHGKEASRRLHADWDEERAFMRTLLGLRSDALGDEALGVPLAPVSEFRWQRIISALTPRGEALEPAGEDELAEAGEMLKRELVDLAGSLPAGAMDIDPPAVSVANLVRARMKEAGFTSADMQRLVDCTPALVKKMTMRTTKGRGSHGGARAASLDGVRKFCRPLRMDPHVVYLCGLSNEIPGAKRKKDGCLHEPRNQDASTALGELAKSGAPDGALEMVRLYVSGSERPALGDTSYWQPFQDLIAWERECLGLPSQGA
jgi:hypothetical protein